MSVSPSSEPPQPDRHRYKRWLSIQAFKLLALGRRPRKTDDLRVVVLEFGHLGDAVLLLPLLQCLEASPRISTIDVIGGPWLEAVLRLGCTRTRLIPHAHPKSRRDSPGAITLLRDAVSIGRAVRGGRYDVCIETKGTLNSVVFAFLSRAPWLLGTDWYRKGYPFDAVTPFNRDHEARRKLALVAPLELDAAAVSYRMHRNAADERAVAEALSPLPAGRYMILHVNCPWPPRLWPVERQRELLDRMLARFPDLQVVLIGTDADRPVAALLNSGLGGRVHDYCGRFTLGQLVPLARSAALYLGSDSGPAHLAAAAGGRLVVLLGPAEYPRFAPFNPEATIHGIRHEVCVHQRNNSCAQILSQRTCVMGDNLCMKAITVDEVFARCASVLENGSRH